ncbi:hypothetical protein FIBSPDRAFT_856463, partial [Athelia psychrophila]
TARSVAWGTLFPGTTLLLVIGLGYSIIAPVINGLVRVCFAFFYLLQYLLLRVLEQLASSNTGGLFFPKAINHILVRLYVQQSCWRRCSSSRFHTSSRDRSRGEQYSTRASASQPPMDAKIATEKAHDG